jgi:hypothetical protein
MERSEYRIIFSTIAVFFSIAGMAAVIHGMLFDESNVTLRCNRNRARRHILCTATEQGRRKRCMKTRAWAQPG